MSRRVWLGGGAAAVLVIALASLLAQPRAGTPFALVSSNPAGGATPASAPAEVELAFTAAVDPGLSHMSVVDGSGATVSVGPPYLAGPERLRQRVRIVRAGEVTVAYHVTSAGGAELAGSLRFGMPGGAAGDAAALPAAAQAVDHQHGVDPVGAVLLALDGLVAFTVVVLLLVRPPAGRVRRDPADWRASRWRAPR